MKDARCSSNSARVFQLFGGDDQAAKRGAWLRDWRRLREQIAEATAGAIRSMDEHWDGGGYPDGIRRADIPLLARIVGLAQVAEIFASEEGRRARRRTYQILERVPIFGELAFDARATRLTPPRGCLGNGGIG